MKIRPEKRPWPELARYAPNQFTRGRSLLVVGLWIIIDAFLISSWIPGSWHRRVLLRAFGARIGRNVVIKPRVRIKFPWRLIVGDYSWIGEEVWIDNLALVTLEANVCISQGAYLCTGSHDWSRSTFDLRVKPITIAEGGWVAAKATVGPGVIIGEGAVLGLSSVATSNLSPWTVNVGNPANIARKRV